MGCLVTVNNNVEPKIITPLVQAPKQVKTEKKPSTESKFKPKVTDSPLFSVENISNPRSYSIIERMTQIEKLSSFSSLENALVSKNKEEISKIIKKDDYRLEKIEAETLVHDFKMHFLFSSLSEGVM